MEANYGVTHPGDTKNYHHSRHTSDKDVYSEQFFGVKREEEVLNCPLVISKMIAPIDSIKN